MEKIQDKNSPLFKALSTAMKAINSDWIPQNFASTGDITPTATLNHLYFPVESGTIFGQPIPSDYSRYVLVGNGTTGFSVETIKTSTQPLKYKANLEIVSNNLFNKETRADGFYVDTNLSGKLVASASYFTSDFIPVNELTDYSCGVSQFGAYYDENFNHKSGAWRNTPTTAFTTPSGVAYVRMSFSIGTEDTKSVNEGTTLLDYDNYKQEVITSQLTRVYDKIAESKVVITENDWYDPDFIHQYFNDTEANFKTQEGVDFAFLTSRSIVSTISPDGKNSAMITAAGTALFNISPAWTRDYFESLGYGNGNKIKFGFWIKLPGATSSTTRRVYLGGDTYDTTYTILNSEWTWVESSGDIFVDSEIWQNIYVGLRDMEAYEVAYIRGLTLTNLTNDKWIGERRSRKLEYALNQDFKNLNQYVEKIFDNSPLMEGGYEQNGLSFTKTKITVPELGIDGVRFTCNTAGALFRFNISHAVIELGDIDKFNLPVSGGYLKYGFWLKANTQMTSDKMYLYNGETTSVITDSYIIKGLDYNVWHWVEIPALKLGEGIKDVINLCQINGTPLSAGDFMEFEVCGLTISYLSDPLVFRFNTNYDAKFLRFFGKNFTSFGDSITAANNWQKMVNNKFASNHYLRGIGGTTMRNKGSIAWVDGDGKYIDRPPSAPPSGTEGIDYFEIESSMCRQERVDTIPLNTNFITIMAGTNDWNDNVVIGTRNDAASDALNGTFYAAWKSFFDKLKLRIPNACVFVLNMPERENESSLANSNGDYMYQFREAVREVCQMYSIPVFEMNVFGVLNGTFSNYSADNVHPNSIWASMIGDRAAREISNYNYPDNVKGV